MEATTDDVRKLINLGETDLVEFKSSLRYDFETDTVNRELTKAVAKAVAGFLNAKGGTLLVGISDAGSVIGIEPDIVTLSKPNRDGFEMTLRNAIGSYLGVEISPRLAVIFVELDGTTVAHIACPSHHSPVFLQDGDRQEFYVRDGNQTRPLDVRASHEYIRDHWPPAAPVPVDALREILSEAMSEQLRPVLKELLGGALDKIAPQGLISERSPAAVGREMPPDWIKIATRSVLDLFLSSLARSPGWKRIFLISPWLSEIEHSATLTSNQLVKRMRDDGTTAYVVTRPPVEDWHSRALVRLGESGRANVVTVPGLHIKLYTAITTHGAFAMIGSANFTQQALVNREIGLLLTSFGDGRRLVSELNYEAANIYRLPERRILYRASFQAV